MGPKTGFLMDEERNPRRSDHVRTVRHAWIGRHAVALPILTLLLILLHPLAAVSEESSAQGWIPRSILFGFGNDNITYGIARNNDDGLSYGGRILVEAPLWWAELAFEGYTNRGWKTTWDADAEPYQGRYDVARLGYGMHLSPLRTMTPSWADISVRPYFGLHLAGNLGLVEIQNRFHKIINRPYLTIDYDAPIGDPLVSAELGAIVSVGSIWNLAGSAQGKISLAVDGQAEVITGFETQERIGVLFSLLAADTQVVSFKAGWIWQQGMTQWPTQRLMSVLKTGPVIGFDIRAGLLAVEFSANPAIRSGYGIVSIDAGVLMRTPTWRRSDLDIAMGAGYLLGRSVHLLKIEAPIATVPGLSVVGSVQYKGGPLDPEGEEDEPEAPRKRSNNASWIASARWRAPERFSEGWVVPYGQAGVGFISYDMIEHINHIADSTAPVRVVFGGLRPLVDIEAGLSIIPQGAILSGNSTYRLELGVGLSHVFGTGGILQAIEGEAEVFSSVVRPWMARMFLCLTAGIDL